MVFRSRALALRPVVSLKHIFDAATSAVGGDIVSTLVPIEAVREPNLLIPNTINQGSVVKSMYMRIEVLATGLFNGVPRVYMAVQKNPGNAHSTTNPNDVGVNDLKRFIIHQEMTMVGEVGDSPFPRTMFQGVIKLPRGYQRFGYNDRLTVQFSLDAGETTGVVNVCGQFIYKEFM